ncbi:MAG: ABC transporter ATP-binding protein [Candidatus Bathyarchaeota archaeon]|nr:ABC transporter ATP-binding protein [Candidatus Bathyarchaeota archaeon]
MSVRKGTSIVELVDVWKAYDEVQALRGFDLEIHWGEMFGLVGPNGAGKTTALKIIVGLLRMDKGLVKVKEYDIRKDPYEYKRFVGYVPEVVSLPDYLTVEEFLIYSGRIRSVLNEKTRERMDFYLRTFDLENKRKTLILLLSRGMKQKAAMASALIHDPDLLILDEPLVGIDPAGQHRIKQLFNERMEDGKTVFISTHMLDTAERMCDRVAVIHKGRNVASGDLKSLQKLSETAEHATLEEVFLKLTEESEEQMAETPSDQPTERRRRGLFGRFRRVE